MNKEDDNQGESKSEKDNNIDTLSRDREIQIIPYIASPHEEIPLDTRDSRLSSWSMSIAQSANDDVYGNAPKPSICSQIKSKILTILCCRCNQGSSNNNNMPSISAPFLNSAFIHDRPGPSYYDASTDEEEAHVPIVNPAFVEKFEVMSNSSEAAIAGSFNEENSFNQVENSNMRSSNLNDENGDTIQSSSIQALSGSFHNIPVIRQDEQLYINLPLANHTYSEKSDIVPSDPDHEVNNEEEYLIKEEEQEESIQGVINAAFINVNEVISDNADHTANSVGEGSSEEISCSGVIP